MQRLLLYSSGMRTTIHLFNLVMYIWIYNRAKPLLSDLFWIKYWQAMRSQINGILWFALSSMPYQKSNAQSITQDLMCQLRRQNVRHVERNKYNRQNVHSSANIWSATLQYNEYNIINQNTHCHKYYDCWLKTNTHMGYQTNEIPYIDRILHL